MSSRFVRSSKFRHVFGSPAKKEACIDNVRISRTAWDTNFIAANPEYLAIAWESGGGGAFAVVPANFQGRMKPDTPLFNGHVSAVIDLEFSPFNDALIASASEDCTAKIWAIPDDIEGGERAAAVTLSGHQRKVGHVRWNPTAENILATTSPDKTIKVWDVNRGEEKLTMEAHNEMIQSFCWNYDGSLGASTARDKTVKVWDPRQQKAAGEGEGHQGLKGSRSAFMGRQGTLASIGFSRTSEREFWVWDPRDMSKPLHKQEIDQSSGVLMPFYDDGTGVLFLAGKGDGNIRYFEITSEGVFFLSQHTSTTPQRGMAFAPKRAVDVSTNEIMKCYKLEASRIEPISFQVPRKADTFQADLYPDCPSAEPALTAEEWLGGKTAEPKLMSLEPGTEQASAKKSASFAVADDKARISELEQDVADKDAKIAELQKKLAALEGK